VKGVIASHNQHQNAAGDVVENDNEYANPTHSPKATNERFDNEAQARKRVCQTQEPEQAKEAKDLDRKEVRQI